MLTIVNSNRLTAMEETTNHYVHAILAGMSESNVSCARRGRLYESRLNDSMEYLSNNAIAYLQDYIDAGPPF